MALDAENHENTIGRWRTALTELRADTSKNDPHVFDLNVVIAIDVSGSMTGKRINAVKLGLCCLAASLNPSDTVRLLSFSSAITDLSGGSIATSDFLPMLPALLVAMRAEGSTSFYDAVLRGLDAFPLAPVAPVAPGAPPADAAPVAPGAADPVGDVAVAAAVPAPGAVPAVRERRNVLLTLTDGEDTVGRGSCHPFVVTLLSSCSCMSAMYVSCVESCCVPCRCMLCILCIVSVCVVCRGVVGRAWAVMLCSCVLPP